MAEYAMDCDTGTRRILSALKVQTPVSLTICFQYEVHAMPTVYQLHTMPTV